MPTYFPKGRTNKKFAEKMTFRGAGVEGLFDVIDTFIPDDANRDVISSSQGKAIFDYVTSDDFNETRTPIYEYLPDHTINSKFPAKLTLRGAEVDALKEVLSLVGDADLSPEAEFLKSFVENQMGGEKLHLRFRGQKSTIDNLPATGNSSDAWLVDGNLYVWNEDESTWCNINSVRSWREFASVGSVNSSANEVAETAEDSE